jgi:membrane associated rhomboid family serine protease
MDFESPFTFLFLGLTVLVSWQAIERPQLLARLLLWPPAVQRHSQYDRLFTYGLVHADWGHLLFNMITLYFFGREIESFLSQQFGLWAFPLFYISALLVSVLPGYFKHANDPNYRTLGASGAVSAVLFAFILLKPWNLIFVFFIPVPAIVYGVLFLGYSIYMDRRGTDSINHSAHLWGAVYGVVFLIIAEPRVLPFFLQNLLSPLG